VRLLAKWFRLTNGRNIFRIVDSGSFLCASISPGQRQQVLEFRRQAQSQEIHDC
jgi:hypothetical protein